MQHNLTAPLCFKISLLTPGFHFPIRQGAYKEQGREMAPQRIVEGRSQQRAPTPISALLTLELARLLLSIMKVSGAVLAALLCAVALCSQVFSAPRESALLLSVPPLWPRSDHSRLFSWS